MINRAVPKTSSGVRSTLRKQRKVDLCEFKAIYILSARPAKVTKKKKKNLYWKKLLELGSLKLVIKLTCKTF